MEKRIRPVMLAACLLWLMPLSAWAASPPTGQVEGDNIGITGGRCTVKPQLHRAPLTYDQSTGEWTCNRLSDKQLGPKYNVQIEFNLRAYACQEDGGNYVGDACWFLGRPNEACSTTCENIGRIYDVSTATYAGSRRDGGTYEHCVDLLKLYVNELPVAEIDHRGQVANLGCILYKNAYGMWFSVGPTTPGSRGRLANRVCACQMEDD